MSFLCSHIHRLISEICKLQDRGRFIGLDGKITIHISYSTMIGAFYEDGSANERFLVFIEKRTLICTFLSWLLGAWSYSNFLFLQIDDSILNHIRYTLILQELV